MIDSNRRPLINCSTPGCTNEITYRFMVERVTFHDGLEVFLTAPEFLWNDGLGYFKHVSKDLRDISITCNINVLKDQPRCDCT